MFRLGSTVSVRPVSDQRLRRFVALSHASMVSIIAVGCTCVLGLVADAFYAQHLQGFPADTGMDEMELEVSMLFSGLAGLAQVACWVVAATCFILWFRRAYQFLDEMEGVSREHGLSWTSWGFVVPVISLWWPYSIMREIWDAFTQVWGQRPDISASHKMPQRWIGVWWGFYLSQAIVSNGAFRLSMRDTTVGDTLYSQGFTDLSNLMTLLAVPSAVFVIHQTTRLVEPALRIASVPPVPTPPEAAPPSDVPAIAPPT